MTVVRRAEEIPESVQKGSSLTIGNFDGVHRGHHQLIRKVKDRAEQHGLVSLALTFDPHPLRVLRGDTPPFLTPTPEKLRLLQQLGLDYVLCLEFNREMANLSPEEFVRRYLVQGLNCKWLIIGYDYSFGKGGQGNYHTLLELGKEYGFHTERVEAVLFGGEAISSTRIRNLIQQGQVAEVEPLLGRQYSISGKVVEGSRRGGPILNVPTANLEVVDELLPLPGVYAVWAECDGWLLPAVANVGRNPTFNQESLSVEVHIFNFSRDIYGQRLGVTFVRRLRGEIKFSGVQELKEQIHRDIEQGKQVLGEQARKTGD